MGANANVFRGLVPLVERYIGDDIAQATEKLNQLALFGDKHLNEEVCFSLVVGGMNAALASQALAHALSNGFLAEIATKLDILPRGSMRQKATMLEACCGLYRLMEIYAPDDDDIVSFFANGMYGVKDQIVSECHKRVGTPGVDSMVETVLRHANSVEFQKYLGDQGYGDMPHPFRTAQEQADHDADLLSIIDTIPLSELDETLPRPN